MLAEKPMTVITYSREIESQPSPQTLELIYAYIYTAGNGWGTFCGLDIWFSVNIQYFDHPFHCQARVLANVRWVHFGQTRNGRMKNNVFSLIRNIIRVNLRSLKCRLGLIEMSNVTYESTLTYLSDTKSCVVVKLDKHVRYPYFIFKAYRLTVLKL